MMSRLAARSWSLVGPAIIRHKSRIRQQGGMTKQRQIGEN